MSKKKGKVNTYTKEQIQWVYDNAAGVLTKDLVKMFNERFKTNKMTYSKMKTFKSYRKIRSGVDTKFKPGQESYNKGKKGQHSPGSEKGWFKKGHSPYNKLPIGTILLKEDGYYWIKLKETKPSRFGWTQYHRYLWEEANGPIPEGHVIVFLNKDKSDFRLENMACISRATHGVVNKNFGISTIPEITKVNITRAKMLQKTTKLSKRGKRNG